MSPRRAPGGPRSGPRAPKTAPRAARSAPRGAQDHPGAPQERTKGAPSRPDASREAFGSPFWSHLGAPGASFSGLRGVLFEARARSTTQTKTLFEITGRKVFRDRCGSDVQRPLPSPRMSPVVAGAALGCEGFSLNRLESAGIAALRHGALGKR